MKIDGHTALWLELALTPETSPRCLHPLLERFGTVEDIFAAQRLALGSVDGVSAGAAAAIASRAGKDAAAEELQRIEKEDVGLIPYDAPAYPPLLREIHDPPWVLFSRGEVHETDHIAVAMVGSRRCSAYGAQAAHRLAGDLALRGVTVVSGMAHGIDQAAHNGALAENGRTIAVLGGGLGHIYPAGSDKLVARICERGAVLSEFPWNTPPSKGTFPQRNRIVSGMCRAVLIVEAAERSGALITARLALEQGRELLATPGPIYEKRSFGSNYLIKKGAKLVQHVDDIIEELPEALRARLMEPKAAEQQPGATPEEARVLETLSVDTPLHVDIIAARSGMSAPDISLLLLGLEMKALVKQLPGMEFIKAVR